MAKIEYLESIRVKILFEKRYESKSGEMEISHLLTSLTHATWTVKITTGMSNSEDLNTKIYSFDKKSKLRSDSWIKEEIELLDLKSMKIQVRVEFRNYKNCLINVEFISMITRTLFENQSFNLYADGWYL